MIPLISLVLALVAGASGYDTVVLRGGGVLRGTLIQDVPGESVVIQLPDGRLWEVPRDEVAEVERGTAEPPPAGADEEPEMVPAEPEPVPPLTLDHVPAIQLGFGMGVSFPVGKLDASGLGLGAAVTPQAIFVLEGSFRPVPPLEVGIQLLLGLGDSRPPLGDACLEVGAWCSAATVGFGPFLRFSPWPTSSVSPWIMATGGWDWLSIYDEYEDAYDFSGWMAGSAVGVDFRTSPTWSFTLQVGARLGEYASVSARGYLPPIALDPALHGWVDLAFKMNAGF